MKKLNNLLQFDYHHSSIEDISDLDSFTSMNIDQPN